MPQLSGFTDFNPDKDIPSLSGRVVFITGGTAGIGKEAVQALAKHGPAHIYFTGRNTDKANSIVNGLKKTAPGVSTTFISMDMSSLQSVKSAAARFHHDRLDLLICNAGTMDVPPAVSADGYEIHMAVNHIAHALLIRELLPVMLRRAEQPGADVRLVILSSAGFFLHPKEGISWDKIRTKHSGFMESTTRYGQSKLANLAYAAELARRYPQITSVSVHPGFVSTDLVHNSSALGKVFMYGRHWLKGESALRPKEGCLNTLWAAAGATRDGIKNGAYYTPVGVIGELDDVAKSDVFAAKLWSWTNELLDEV